MTFGENRGSFYTGSIVRVTGWTGAHGDEPPSIGPATTPDAKHIDGQPARCFDVFEGEIMGADLQTKNSIVTRMTAPLELRFAASKGTIEGYASAFGGPPDAYGDIIEKGAFRRTIADHLREGTMPAMLWAHDPSRPIGRWDEMHEDDFGLHMRGTLNLGTTAGKDAHQHLEQGDVRGLSIGFVVAKSGARQNGATTILTDLDLMEVSAVVFPANRRARISGVKSLASKSELVDLLREAGLPKTAAHRIASGGWPALSGDDHQKAIDLAAQIEAATAKIRSL